MKSRKKITLKWFTDASHGWLRVSRKNAEELGILGSITGYSYESEKYLFLEEDRDALEALNALKNRPDLQAVFLIGSHAKERSHVRKYNHYWQRLYSTVYRRGDSLYTKLDNVEAFIRTHIKPNYSIPRPSDEYPWGLEQFYDVLDTARNFIKEHGWYAYHDAGEALIVTNMRDRMVLDNAKLSDKLSIIHVK